MTDNGGQRKQNQHSGDYVYISVEIHRDEELMKMPGDEWYEKFIAAVDGEENEFSKYIAWGTA